MTSDAPQRLVVVIGAGPAGLFAARELALHKVHVVLLNRDIKPGGLAEYGIYPDKHRMKEGLRAQFRQILCLPEIEYFGNVCVGDAADLSLEDMRRCGCEVCLVTVGAQGTKRLGLPGEESLGVYHAKDLVYHYNRLPPFSQRRFEIGKRVGVVGAGNVMADIATWLVRDQKVEEVRSIVRRGPGEVKFDRKEFERVAANLDLALLESEIERVAPLMHAVGQDPAQAKAFLLSTLPKAPAPVSKTRVHFDFLASPTALRADGQGRLAGVEVEDTALARVGNDIRAQGLGTRRVIPLDTIIFAIGDKVDEGFGLPVQGSSFVKTPLPRFPQEGNSYEVQHREAVFVAGWSREASTGLVGVAHKDGTLGATAVLGYLGTLPSPAGLSLDPLRERLHSLAHPVVQQEDIARLEQAERREAERRGLEEWKFATNEEMLAAMKMAKG